MTARSQAHRRPSPLRSAWGWWSGLDPAERVLYRSLVLLGAGCGLIYPPLVLIVPGLVLALTFFGFGRRR